MEPKPNSNGLQRNDIEGAVKRAKELHQEGRLDGGLLKYLLRLQDDDRALYARLAAEKLVKL